MRDFANFKKTNLKCVLITNSENEDWLACQNIWFSKYNALCKVNSFLKVP